MTSEHRRWYVSLSLLLALVVCRPAHSGEECGPDGLNLEASYDAASRSVGLSWNAWPDVATWRVLRDDEVVAATLDAAVHSWTDDDVAAAAPLPSHTYTLVALGAADNVLASCESTVATFKCPSELSCQWLEEDGSALLSWTPGDGSELEGIEIRRAGELVSVLEPSASEFTDTELSGRVVDYELVPVMAAADLCPPLACSLLICSDEPFETPLRINLGGGAATDSSGRRWLADNPERGTDLPGDVLCIRPDDAGAARSFAHWCLPTADAFAAAGFDPQHPGDIDVLGSVRWDDATDATPFALEVPLASGTYDVSLWFTECCCPSRHFKTVIEDELVDADVHHEAGASSRRTFEEIVIADGTLDIDLLACLAPECPGSVDGNATLAALEVVRHDVPFHRGDSNDDGGVDISDAVTVLLWLFASGDEPGCTETADFNDSGKVDISDAVALLAYLFQGGPPPPSPGATNEECGDDAGISPANLSCSTYSSC